MYDRKKLAGIAARRKKWNDETLAPSLRKSPSRLDRFSTVSDEEIDLLYTPDLLSNLEYEEDLGYPGQFPYTRGVQPTMYRGRLWTMRQFAGFGSAEDTNARFKFLLSQGQTGLSTAFHFPRSWIRLGLPRARGEVACAALAVDSLKDMEILFDGIPLDKVTTSMTINGPAAMVFAMYLAVAEKQGVPFHKVGGTIQNDILKEYIAQHFVDLPSGASMRIITDILAYCADNVPRWNTISISGTTSGRRDPTAVQELAFTIADGIAYVQAGSTRGSPWTNSLHGFRTSSTPTSTSSRRSRSTVRRVGCGRASCGGGSTRRTRIRGSSVFTRRRRGARSPRQQPMNNVVRVALQALSGVLGGTQSLHTNSMDETLALPTEQAVTVALRTQQIIAEESASPTPSTPSAARSSWNS